MPRGIRRVLLVALLGLPATADAQDIQGIGQNVPGSPVVIGISGDENGWFEPDGIRVDAYVNNTSSRTIVAYEMLVVGLNPFNVVRTINSRTVAETLRPADDRTDALHYAYLGTQDIYTVIGVVSKVRYQNGEVWAPPAEAVRLSITDALSNLDLSAIPIPALGLRLDGVAGVYTFQEIHFSAGWGAPAVDGACATYLAAAPGAAALTLPSGAQELISSREGDRLLVCDGVVHVVPGDG